MAKTLTSFEGERLAGDEDDIGAFVPSFHLIVLVSWGGPRLPLSARRVVQTCSLVSLAANISGANYAVPICDSKIQKTSRVNVFALHYALRYACGELVNDFNGLKKGLAQYGWTETVLGLGAGIRTQSFQAVHEQGKRPFAIRTALNEEIPFIVELFAQTPLDVLPATQTTVVHPHQTAIGKGVAVVFAQGTFCGSADVGEDQPGGGFGGEAVQVGAVPSGHGGCEEARTGAEFRIGVEANAEAVGIVLAASGILPSGVSNGWKAQVALKTASAST